MNSEVDYFFVVGAMKGGTTSLFKYLKEHPEIHMPDEKEVPFFHKDGLTDESWGSYKTQYLTPTNGESKAGTASPQYMCDYRVAGRMVKFAPDAKIIVVLRDPIERAVSHYKMLVRWGVESRNFNDVVTHQLQPHIIEIERNRPYAEGNLDDSYVCRGEYKRIVDIFNKYYPGNVLVISSDDLRYERKNTLENIYNFIGVDSSFLPKNISKTFHASEAGFPDRAKLLVNSKLIRFGARLILSSELRAAIRLRYFSYMNAKSEKVLVDHLTYKRLCEHYLVCNEGLVGFQADWFNKKLESNGSYIF